MLRSRTNRVIVVAVLHNLKMFEDDPSDYNHD